MKRLIQFPAEFDYNLLLHVLRDYKKPRDKIRSLIRGKDIIRVKKGLYVLGKDYNKPYNKYVLANLIYGPSYITGQTALAFWNMIPERVELMISMTTKRKKQFETPVGKFSYLYCLKTAFSIGIQLEDAGDEKNFLIASDYSFYENLNFSLLEEIKAGYRRQRLKLLINCLKDGHV